MADAWNQRVFGEFSSNTVICKTGNVDQDLVESLRRKLSVDSKLLSRNPLWHEMNTMKAVIYKHHNQQRHDKHFKEFKRVYKYLIKLKEMDLEKILITFMNALPKKNVPITCITRYPCYEAVQYVLLRLMGASKVAVQAIHHCKMTFHYACSQLKQGHFITLHVVLSAAASRVWVLLKDLIQNFIECYEVVYPWLNIVKQTGSEGKDSIPSCLKIWMNVDIEEPPTIDTVNNNTLSDFTPKTSSLLNKMFSFTPQTDKDYQDSPKTVEGSVIVPRNMFQEQLEFTNVDQENQRKRKHTDLENAPERKKLLLDNNENIVNTTQHHKKRKSSIESNDKISMENAAAQTTEVNNEPSAKKRKRKKEHNIEVELSQKLVDIDDSLTDEVNSKKKKKKKAKNKEQASPEEVLILDDVATEVNDAISTKKLKKSKKTKEKEDTEKRQPETLDFLQEVNCESHELNEEQTKKKHKKKKKEKQETNKNGIHIENSSKPRDLGIVDHAKNNELIEEDVSKKKTKKTKKKDKEKLDGIAEKNNDEVVEQKSSKKSKKSKKQHDEKPVVLQQEINDSYSSETTSSTKEKKKKKDKDRDKTNKNEKSCPELLVEKQDSMDDGIEKKQKPNKEKKKEKRTLKTSNDKDYFDNLFSALGV